MKSSCLRLVSKLNDGDQDALLSRLDELQAQGVPAAKAQVQAAIDVLMRVQADGASIQRSAARDVTETPEFAAWFGDSKVVDADGNPLVVYHGSKADIAVFSDRFNRKGLEKGVPTGGLFFAPNPALASRYAVDGAVYPVYLRLRSPMPYEVFNGGRQKGVGGYSRDALFPGGFDINDPSDVARAEEHGYDGLMFGGNEIVVFRPEQIKSAIGNNGNFDPADPNITRSVSRDTYAWRQSTDTPTGPLLEADGFWLIPQREIVQSDFDDGGFGDNGLLGHAERAVPGTRTIAYRIVGDNGIIGTLVSDVDPAGVLRSVHDIEITDRRSGIGSKVVATIAANTKAPIKIQDITDEADPFWTRIGVGYKDQYGDAFLDWEDVAQYLGTRGAAQLDPDAAASEGRGRGLQEGSYEVTELSDEEAAGLFKFSKPRVTELWRKYAEADSGFKFGRDALERSKSIADLAKAFSSPSIRLSEFSVQQPGGSKTLIVNGDPDNGNMTLADVNGDGSKFKIQAADATPYSGRSGDQGSRMYQALLAYAHNNGIVVDADFSLTPVNELRRTSALLSSALRFDSTKHIGELSDQQGVTGWTGESFADDVAALAEAELRMVEKKIPAAKQLEIDKNGTVRTNSEEVLAAIRDAGDRRESVDSRSALVESRRVGSEDTQGASNRQTGPGAGDARLRDGNPQDDVYASSGAPTSLAERLAELGGARIEDQELVDYLASTSGGFGAHGVGINTLKRALVTKAAIQNGVIETSQQGLLFSLPRPAFYSQLQRSIEQVPDRLATMAAPQWKLWLDANASKLGIKKDEIEWSGIKDFLDLQGKAKVTRDQLVAYLGDNGVRVQETVMVEDADLTSEERTELSELRDLRRRHEGGERGVLDPSDVRRLRELEFRSTRPAGSTPKYGSYTVPGGNNYREVLITLPDGRTPAPEQAARPTVVDRGPDENGRGQFDVVLDGEVLDTFTTWSAAQDDALGRQEDENIRRNLAWRKSQPDVYKSSHWDQPNVLAHIRVNDRVDADGRKVLFVEELQSDWGQDAKKKGIKSPFNPTTPEVTAKVMTGREFVAERSMPAAAADAWLQGRNDIRRDLGKHPVSLDDTFTVIYEDGVPKIVRDGASDAEAAAATHRKRYDAMIADARRRHELDQASKVPNAPFVTKTEGWLNLALKRVIAMAVDGDYDAVAFVNGDQSADRYDLSKQISKVEATKMVQGKYAITASDLNGTRVLDDIYGAGALPDVVGKELAERIVAEAGTSAAPGKRHSVEYSGLDLKVGGEGMRAFYDQIVPQVARDVLKKLGGSQLRDVAITTDKEGWHITPPSRTASGKWMVKSDDYNSVGLKFDTEEAARAALKEKQTTSQQPGFDITQAMREKVSAEGLPLFSRKRGWQGFPDSVVDTNLGAQSKDPSYEAAKAGDMKAALELVSRVMSSDAEDKVRRMIGDSKPIVVSVHAEESTGRNKIPLATAIELGDRLGLEVDTKIVQATRAKRTGADGMARIGVQPEFTGDVVRGADYLIVDDTLTQGGTIAQLKTYIEDNGGRVVGSFALSGKQYSAKISLDEQTLSQLRERYGSIEPWWRSELGYGFDGLTQSEARFILKSGLSPDQVRDRVAAARQAAGIGAGAQDQAQLSAKRDVTETPEFKHWFGDSKVVDADGKPLVVYHGTASDEGFTVFEPAEYVTKKGAFWFTADKEMADGFAQWGSESSDQEPRTIAAYLSIRNPLIMDAADMMKDGKHSFDAEYAAIQRARDGGYDGMLVRNVPDMDRVADQWVALRPEQIKSATGNNGQFDPSNPDITKSLPRIPGLNAGSIERTTGDYGREYTPQQLRMFKNVGRTTTKPALIDRLKEARKDLGRKMAQGIVDQFRPIRDLGGNAYTLARLSKGAAGAFEALLGHGKLKIVDGAYDADTTGGFLDRVGKPLGKELEDFMFWVASNRAESLSLQDRENLFTQDDIDAGKSLADGDLEFDYLLANGATTRDRRAAYEDSLAKFNEFNKNVLDIAEESGLIDGDSRQYWEGEFYVPFYRVSEEDGEFVGAKIKGGLARQRAFHELKGGSQKLNSDLLANTMRNWAHLIDASAKNRAAKATLESAANVGIALEADAETVRQLGKSIGGKGGTVWFMDGGQQRHFLIGDPYLLEAINSLEYAGLRGPLMDALSTMKHWLTVGVTASPAFKVRNLIRDSIQAISLSGLSYNPVKNLVEGYKATDRESQDYVSALASGGLIRFGTMLEGNAAERVRRLVQKGVPASTILNTPGKVKDFYGKFVEPAVEAYQELGNRGEEINRASLYKQLRAQGVNHAEASLMARDLMDFSMQGTWTSIRFLTQVVPFLNARLQGLYKLGRGAAEDPKRFAMVAGATALVSIALLGAYGDDDDWKKREDWDRDGFWWFKFGGTAFRIPKPFEVGAIATLAERGVELFTNDEFTAKRFGSRVMHLLGDNLAMNPIPQAVKPLLDIYANKDSFSGRPIESMGMERLKSEYRFNVSTSMVARGASTALNTVTGAVGGEALSPVQIDHLVRAYFGWLGTFVVAGADMAIRPLTSEPARPQADYLKVVTQGFLRTLPEPGSKYVSAMYDQAKIMEQAYATHRQLLKEGKVDEAREFAAENKDLMERYRLIESVKKVQSGINRRIREIEISDMEPSRKREEIRRLRDQADRSARAVY